jgi:hypothetical protein
MGDRQGRAPFHPDRTFAQAFGDRANLPAALMRWNLRVALWSAALFAVLFLLFVLLAS